MEAGNAMLVRGGMAQMMLEGAGGPMRDLVLIPLIWWRAYLLAVILNRTADRDGYFDALLSPLSVTAGPLLAANRFDDQEARNCAAALHRGWLIVSASTF